MWTTIQWIDKLIEEAGVNQKHSCEALALGSKHIGLIEPVSAGHLEYLGLKAFKTLPV